MKVVPLPSATAATRTWRERLLEIGATSFDTLARLTNPFQFFARALRLTTAQMADDLGVEIVVVELLLAGEASELIEPVREGLRRQGLDAAEVARWYEEWLEAERARWAA